jgi:hypothetical protein
MRMTIRPPKNQGFRRSAALPESGNFCARLGAEAFPQIAKFLLDFARLLHGPLPGGFQGFLGLLQSTLQIDNLLDSLNAGFFDCRALRFFGGQFSFH